MIRIDWNPVAHLGPVPINWYGLGWAAAFLAGRALALRAAGRAGIPRERMESLLLWILFGAFAGARLYYVAQNDPLEYLSAPWRIAAVWEGGLAFFGGLVGAIGTAYLYARRTGLSFGALADLFAPIVPIAAAIGRIPCGLDGMDYGTPTSLPWGVVYLHPNSYAPNDGIPRHPVQFYELFGDLAIAAILMRLRGRMPKGGLFLLYVVLFSSFRFALFFLRGDVPIVALGLKNGQLTALAILIAASLVWVMRAQRRAIPSSL